MPAIKILDATTGVSESFNSPKGIFIFRLSIVGTATSNIKAFFENTITAGNIGLDISGITGSGATVVLQSKMNHPESVFSNTGQVFRNDYTGTYITDDL